MPAELNAEDLEVLNRLRSEWRTNFDQGTQPIRAEIAAIKSTLTALGGRVSKPPGSDGPQSLERGELPGAKFVTSTEFLTWKASPGQRGRVVLAAPFTKASLTNVQLRPLAARLPDILPLPTLPPAVVQLVNWRPIGSGSTVEFLRESVAVAPGAKSQLGEGALKTEQTISVELIAEIVETIAAWTSASLQALSDTDQLARFIDSVLTTSVLNEVDRQVLHGTGAAAHELVGIVPNAVPYDTALTLAGDGPLDILSHAQAQLYATGVVATAVVLSASDSERVKLTKDTAGNYIWGSPAAGAPASVWGLTPVVDPNLAAGFIVGDFSPRSIELLWREMLVTEVSREHADFFVKNLAAIRSEGRCANGLYRPSAFVTGTFPAPATLGAVNPRK